MRVFDFDGTIYDGDSTVDFFLFALRHCPACLKALPAQAAAALRYVLKRCTLDEFKGRFYTFLRYLPDTDAAVHAFWEQSWNKVKPEIARLVQKGDVIASASPAFLLAPAADRLDASLIASEVDRNTGELLGPNCRDVQKAKRLKDAGLEGCIDAFYTDSKADAPCVAMAREGILVTGTRLSTYPYGETKD